MSVDLATVGRIEAATLATWPALTTRRDGSWVLRRSEGQTGRANSITILDPHDDADPERRLAEAALFYREAGLTPLIRATPLTPPAVVAHLRAADDARAGDTVVMVRALAGGDATPAGGVVCERRASNAWLEATATLMGFTDARRDAIGRKLATLAAPAGFFAIRNEEGAVATALAVASGDFVALFDIAVDPVFRRQGFGQAIVKAAFAWGRQAGAREAFLQVVADNRPAIGLYRRLGFAEVYRYRYMTVPNGAGL